MSILDTILGSAEQHPELNRDQHSSLVQTALQMFGNQGGLSSLLQSAQGQGLAQIVQSWIGNGTNQPIDASQLEELVGQDRINQLATRVGVPPALASSALSRVLPVIVDKVTPQGKLPKAA